MEFVRYILLTSVYAAVLWGIYAMTLRNSPALRASRAFLLCALVLSALLPLLHAPQQMLAGKTFAVDLPAIPINGSGSASADTRLIDALPQIYAAICLAFAVATAAGYLRLRIRLNGSPAARAHGYILVRDTGLGPGTLGRRVFIPGAAAEPAILRHELGHIRAGHRYDLLVLAASRCLLWISPAHWLLARELRVVHEFEADRFALAGTSSDAYAALLLGGQFRIPTAAFIHSFFHHPIKRRIMMLHKHAGKGAGTMLAATLLITAGFAGSVVIAQTKDAGKSGPAVAAVSRTPLDPDHLRRTYGQPVAGTVAQTADGRMLFSKVDQMPQFDGNMGKWLLANVRSPEKEMQGKVIIQFTVDAAGNVILPVLTQSSNNPRLDAEALRVVRSMPRWKPGMQQGMAVPVLYTLPFLFGSIGEGC